MNILKSIWSKIDGKKLITGVLVSILTGVVTALKKQYPGAFGFITDEMILTAAGTGAAFIIGGGAHKIVKSKTKNGGKS